MSNSEVAVKAITVTSSSIELSAVSGANAPGVTISLNTPDGGRGNGWKVAVEYTGSSAVAGADADAKFIRVILSSTAAERTLGAFLDAVEAIDHDSHGNPFSASVAYANSAVAGTVIAQDADGFAPSSGTFAGGATAFSPPVNLISGASLAVGTKYRLQAQSTGSIWITEQPAADGAPDTASIPSFLLPSFDEFWIEPETDMTIWVYAVGADGVVGVNE